MRNKLIKKTVRTAALLIAVVIFVTSFTVYINCAAVSGREVESSLQVKSGDPSVLAGISFNIWANEYYFYTKSSNSSHVSNVLRNAISFNETGQPKVTSYSQVHENVYLNDYILNNVRMELTKDLELRFGAGEFKEAKIPGFQIDTGLKEVMKYDAFSTPLSMYNNKYYLSYSIDENLYFTMTSQDIQHFIYKMYDWWEIGKGSYDQWSFSLTSGIFRTDGKTIENILPIEISSDNEDTNVFDLVYIPQTKCFALSVAENFNELYIYIYHLETGAVEKHYIAAWHDLNEETGEWDIPAPAYGMPLYVNDNLVTVATGQFLACIETDKTAGSVRRHRFIYEHDFIYKEGWLINTYEKEYACFLTRDEYFYVVSVDDTDRDNVFREWRLNIRVFKEGELVFDGYMPFSQENYPAILTISDGIPFKTEDGMAVKRYVKTYSKKRSVI